MCVMQQAYASVSLQYVTFQVKSFPPVPVFFIHDSITHCRKMFLLIKLLASLLLWVKKSSESLETVAPEQLESL